MITTVGGSDRYRSGMERNRNGMERKRDGTGSGPVWADNGKAMENGKDTRGERLLTADCTRALSECLKYRIGVRVRSKPRRLLFTTLPPFLDSLSSMR